MTHVSVRSPSRAATFLVIAVLAVLPAAARANTLTVSADHVDCPNAGFTSIQAAIDQAAPHDTIDICPGTYYESSTPTNAAASPSEAGSMNGLTIAEPLNIVGAGANKVFIEPNPIAVPLTNSLAGTVPYLRSGGGAVIAITRQSLGNTDFTDNSVSISGVTVESPAVYAEAGIKFFNASGSVTNSVIGPLASATASGGTLATRPYGWGIVVADSEQGAGTGTVMRYVTIANTLVSGYQAGGILFDDAFGPDGATNNNVRSGIIQYGLVENSRVAGAGPTSTIPQVGIEYHSGERGSVTGSEITGNDYTPNPSQSVGILLTDAQTAADPNYPTVPGFEALANNITGNGYGLLNANATATNIPTGVPAVASDGTAADENWWGCAAGPIVGAPSNPTTGCQGISGLDSASNPSVIIGSTPRSAAPPALSLPAVTPAIAPTAQIVNPLNGSSAAAGTPINPIVYTTDNFGVKSVSLYVNSTSGAPVGTIGPAPYSFTWTPGYASIGSTVQLIAAVTNWDGEVTDAPLSVNIVAPAGYEAATIAPTSYTVPGVVYVGLTSTPQLETVTNTGQNPVTIGSLGVTGVGFGYTVPASGGCSPGTNLAIGASCTLDVFFAPTGPGAVTGSLTVNYTAPGSSPLVVALSATGQIFSVATNVGVSSSVPSTLSLSLSSATPSLGSLVAGVAASYSVTDAADVTSTAASATISVYDPSATATGHLVNGAFSLPQPLQAGATDPANPTPVYGPVGSTASPLAVLTYAAPISNDPVTISFLQQIGATDALRTGTYSKTVVVTLSTTSP